MSLNNYSLLNAFVNFLKLPWYAAVAILAIILTGLLVLVAYLEGSFTNGIDWSFWRLGLQAAIIVYVFMIMPLIQRLWNRALQSLHSILPESEQLEIIEKIARYNRRWEWTALLLGVIFFVVLGQPWSWDMQSTDVYVLVTSLVMFGLLGWLIYDGLSSTLRLAQLYRQHLKLDIFDSELLLPVARWSLSVSFAYVGGISISVIFQPLENLREIQNIIIYSVLLCVTVLVFFISMWSTHKAMTSAKERELAVVRENLTDARQKLKQQVAESISSDSDRLHSTLAVWSIYEKHIREAPTWPFNAGILGRLAASVLLPAIIYTIKIFGGLGDFLQWFTGH
ncbi:MAG: hypothetical protein ACFFH0_10815 [Promethearchaeota archaeon]